MFTVLLAYSNGAVGVIISPLNALMDEQVSLMLVNPRRACAARVTVLGLCVCLCVCYSTSHFIRDYSCHKRY